MRFRHNRNKRESNSGMLSSGDKCIICEWAVQDYKGNSLIVGAHVRPLSGGREFDKFDNIIALCPNHHAEFDALNFYIDPDELIIKYRDRYNQYNEKNVSERITHVKKEYIIFRKYLFDNGGKNKINISN